MVHINFADKYNTIIGAVVAVLTAVFGIYWYVFAAFLLLNVIDWLTGWAKAKKKKEESSGVGAMGALKKLGCWVIVLVAFLIPVVFIPIGRYVLGVDLSFLQLLGWWVLAMLVVNEARSILENLVEIGYDVPEFLIRGLAVTEKLIAAKVDMENITNAEDKKPSNDTGGSV